MLVVLVSFQQHYVFSQAACTETDEAIIGKFPAGSSEGSYAGSCAECGKEAYSIFSGFHADEYDDCLTKATGVSRTCADCYAGAGQYGADNCKSACIFSWCSEGCLQCTGAYTAKLAACTGFNVPTLSPCDDSSDGIII